MALPWARESSSVWTGREAIFWRWPEATVTYGGRYNPATDSWNLLHKPMLPTTPTGIPGMDRTEMIVYGGDQFQSNAKRYKPATDSWTDATTVERPGHRDHHGAVWTGKEMIVWGGSIDTGISSQGWPLQSRHRYLDAISLERPRRSSHVAGQRVDRNEAIFWGGYDQLFTYYNDGGRYNPQTDSWTKTNLLKAPSPRVAQGVWTGKEMLLWGGANDSSGGRYNPATTPGRVRRWSTPRRCAGGGAGLRCGPAIR